MFVLTESLAKTSRTDLRNDIELNELNRPNIDQMWSVSSALFLDVHYIWRFPKNNKQLSEFTVAAPSTAMPFLCLRAFTPSNLD